MLTAHNISKAYDKTILENFSYRFPEKGLVLIRGASGCGKTTLLRILCGLEKPDSGEIIPHGDLYVSCVFQEPRLVPHLSALDNVLLVKPTKDQNLALQILSSLGLGQDLYKFPHELSGGMKLRVSIARSLYYGGNLFLWDEPTKELDPENCAEIINIIHTISQNACIVVVTHDPALSGDYEIFL